MQTQLAPEFQYSAAGAAAEEILRKCVHCGFCTATCPTYQVLGDELDGPRGRIYLIKQVLEGASPTRATQKHLDRCLTCRSCETTCPSGVEYSRLLDTGREVVEQRVPRPALERAVRWLLKEGLTSKAFGPALKLGQKLRPVLPAGLQRKVPRASPPTQSWPNRRHARKVLMLSGCVQPSMMPNINIATARVLDALEVETLVAPEAGCCGAIRSHLNDHEGGLRDMRRNIDAWWPHVTNGGVEAIVVNASGCGVTVKDFGHALAHDAVYADRARRISELARDISEWLPEMVNRFKDRLYHTDKGTLVFHPPCTLQHGQRLGGGVERYLGEMGFQVTLPQAENHLCCGSAGTYSVLQPDMAQVLRDRKLAHIHPLQPAAIISANIGCIQHLQSGTEVPVRHWVEVLDQCLTH